MGVVILNFRAVVSSRGEADQHLSKPGDAVLVNRGGPRWLVLSCPCGCGERFPVNLDPRSGPAWRIYNAEGGKMSVFPSVWRDTGCQSHYIIWRGRIYLFGSDNDAETDAGIALDDLLGPVSKRLSYAAWRSFVDVADELGEIPWDVLEACRTLARKRVAEEGTGKLRSHFRLRSALGTTGKVDFTA
ncbi:DUF6527 family protein [Bradyrhizobium sp. 142]|uniref:DUF6527 family protein n=1 Tax=Bradyrhizobium sp. 142 TaxID=2782618 RepID=UPI001FF92D70|nr:DUF6527 family protein [Bradyrhizobium sp. 142]MCK1732333.1 hypothetical protein [Bradyrhizobium sp. 142]